MELEQTQWILLFNSGKKNANFQGCNHSVARWIPTKMSLVENVET